SGRKKHAGELYEALSGMADHVFLLYGDNSAKQNRDIQSQMQAVSEKESLLLIATGQMMGEGYDFPRFDTLFLTTPVKFDGLLTQYVGRLVRRYEGKEEVYVYDYVDGHIPVLHRQHAARLRAYKRMGYEILSSITEKKQEARSIYGSKGYLEVFERDLVEADGKVLLVSPEMIPEKVERFLTLMKPRMEAGVLATVVTLHPDLLPFGDSGEAYELARRLEEAGVKVHFCQEESERFAVLGEDLVWYGGVS
ncbi:MAG: restriction endonuclease subunit R, partial [Blautia sp.]|nr:restriction endonuclease subunit R [Blautia sp.]